jgi:hypothetical protein
MRVCSRNRISGFIEHFFRIERIGLTPIVWVLVYLASLSGLAFYIRNVYVKWNIDPDIGINGRLVSTNELPAPAITI